MCTIEELAIESAPMLKKPETVVSHGWVLSSAIRLAVGAHDRLIEEAKALLPPNAEIHTP
jgi:hypothetical protein